MTNNADQEKYSEYFATRQPLAAGERLIRLYHRVLFRLAARRIPGFRSQRVLEAGPGFGYFAEICRAEGMVYSGVEQNRRQAASLSAAGFDVAVAALPPFPAGKPADLIWLSHVLEHADGFNQARELLLAAGDRLEPRGRVVIVSPDIKSYKEEFWNTDWSHGYPTGLKRVGQLLNETGFEVEYATLLTAGFTNPLLVALCDFFFRWLPVGLLDAAAQRLTGRTLFFSFMTIFGWRQVFLIGRKK